METIISSHSIDAHLHPTPVRVVHVASSDVFRCVGVVTRILVQEASIQSLGGERENLGGERESIGFLLVHDEDGLTMALSPAYDAILRSDPLMESSAVKVAQEDWRAIDIRTGPAAFDSAVIISHVSSRLSTNNISILKFSTFSSDLLLVQSSNLQAAKECLAAITDEEITQNALAQNTSANEESEGQDSRKPSKANFVQSKEANEDSQEVTLENKSTLADFSKCYLSIAPCSLQLASIEPHQLGLSLHALLHQFIHHIDLCRNPGKQLNEHESKVVDHDYENNVATQQESQGNNLSSVAQNDATCSDTRRPPVRFLWSIMSIDGEISVIMDQRHVADFPEETLTICDQHWKAVKLASDHVFSFSETGIVAVMSSPYKAGLSMLNVSTFATNFALVEEDDVSDALKIIKQRLSGPSTAVIW